MRGHGLYICQVMLLGKSGIYGYIGEAPMFGEATESCLKEFRVVENVLSCCCCCCPKDGVLILDLGNNERSLYQNTLIEFRDPMGRHLKRATNMLTLIPHAKLKHSFQTSRMHDCSRAVGLCRSVVAGSLAGGKVKHERDDLSLVSFIYFRLVLFSDCPECPR